MTLRSLGDVVEGVTTARLDPPAAAAIKGSLRIRRVLARAARDVTPDAPTQLRAFVAGRAIRLESDALDRVRNQVLRSHQRNSAAEAALQRLAELAWATHREGDRPSSWTASATTWTSRRSWRSGGARWTPREVLLWLADRDRLSRYAAGVLVPRGGRRPRRLDAGRARHRHLVRGRRRADRRPRPPDSALRVRRRARSARSTRSRSWTTSPATGSPRSASGTTRRRAPRAATRWPPHTARERLLRGGWRPRRSTPTCSIDEAQDFSPMQWRMLGRRGRWSSWTVVGDAAQASWPDADGGAPGPRGGLRQPAALAVPHGHQLPQRPRDLRLRGRGDPHRGARRRHPAGRARDRGPAPRRDGGRRRPPAGPPREMEALLEEVEGSVAVDHPRQLGSRRWPACRARATAGSSSWTRCRPRAWSTTRPSSSTPTRSPGSPPAASACCTSR